jgi:uncharacterized protein YggE
MSGTTTPSTVSVVGEGRVSFTPDVALLMIGVETSGAALDAAQRENAERSTTLRARLAELGLPPGDIQTANYQVGQDHGRDGPTGYRVSNTDRVTVRAIDRVGALLDAAIAAGANRVHQITFGLTDEADALRRAREAAMHDARSKAEHYASLAGLRLGEALAISETGSAPPVPFMRAMRAHTTTPIEPGEGTITAQIHVTYALLARQIPARVSGPHPPRQHGILIGNNALPSTQDRGIPWH